MKIHNRFKFGGSLFQKLLTFQLIAIRWGLDPRIEGSIAGVIWRRVTIFKFTIIMSEPFRYLKRLKSCGRKLSQDECNFNAERLMKIITLHCETRLSRSIQNQNSIRETKFVSQ